MMKNSYFPCILSRELLWAKNGLKFWSNKEFCLFFSERYILQLLLFEEMLDLFLLQVLSGVLFLNIVFSKILHSVIACAFGS